MTEKPTKSTNNKSSNKPKTNNVTEQKTDVKSEKKVDSGQLIPIFIMAIMFVISIGFALYLAPIYESLNFQADFSEFGGEESLIIPFFYLAIILIFTAVILLITRKRRGGFIKYGFLAIICLSMIYVFSAIFTVIFYPFPEQTWSDEVDVESGIGAVLITDLVEDSDQEVIIGTKSGNVEIYDNNFKLLWTLVLPSAGTITDFISTDLNNDSISELIVLSDMISIFEYQGEQGFNNVWLDLNFSYTSIAVIPDYPVENNFSNEKRPVIIGAARTFGPSISGTSLKVIGYQDGYDYLDSSNDIPFSITSLGYAKFNQTNKKELYMGTNSGVYSIPVSKFNLTVPNLKLVALNNEPILGFNILDIDYSGENELVSWDSNGNIYIFDANKPTPRWKRDVGRSIGGVAFGDMFERYNKNYKGLELMVSVDGRLYVYYSYKGFLNENFEVTEEAGRFNKEASGLAIGNLDDNSELDIIVGSENGFKHYQYLTYTPSDIPCFMGLIISILLTIFLFKHPEWYLIDIVGIVVAGGVTALLGISIGLLPIIVLLVVLAIYDAISVYKTKHMVSLADKVMEFKLPILLVIPKKRGYSFIEQKGLKKQLDEGEEREAMFIGLGDIIIPGALVISAFHFLPTIYSVAGIGTNLLVALFTLVGILVGFSALMRYVLSGNPQAGLPLLNTGAILGFLISMIIIYQDLALSLILPFG
jgi:presenilin-like A22 family membrane protease